MAARLLQAIRSGSPHGAEDVAAAILRHEGASLQEFDA